MQLQSQVQIEAEKKLEMQLLLKLRLSLDCVWLKIFLYEAIGIVGKSTKTRMVWSFEHMKFNGIVRLPNKG